MHLYIYLSAYMSLCLSPNLSLSPLSLSLSLEELFQQMSRATSAQMLQCEARLLGMERRWKSNVVELAPNCPRCASSNTKFCYYNNYSLSQPRYFCKGCRRYWTKGGSLRNVPVGGGCRKSRRSKATIRSTVSSSVGGSISPSLPTSHEDPSSMVPPSGSEGSDIDLAAVFAKFLDQGSSVGNTEPVGSLEFAGSSNQDTHVEDTMVECQTRSSVTQLAGLPQIQLGEQIHEFGCRDPNPNLFGLPTMISDELGQDLLWSDPNFECEPAVQLEVFGPFSSEDQSNNISASLISDNWSLFDLPFL